jgi:Holliday junction resolvase RusA-like endonuclease
MSGSISFFVPGIPAPGGSKRGFAIKKGGVFTGRIAMVDAGGQRTKDWRQACVVMANEVRPPEPFRGPLRVDFQFVMPRIKAHFHTSRAKEGLLRDDAPTYHTTKPDRTKLTRSTEDALKGIIWLDDSQIVQGETTKSYGAQPGCKITITPL